MAEETTSTQDNTEVASEETASTQSTAEAQPAEESTGLLSKTGEASDDAESTGLLSRAEDNAGEENVPEQYESFEGEYLTDEYMEHVSSFAKENKLTQSAANNVAQGYDLAINKIMAQSNEASEASRKECESDPKGKENILMAEKALKSMGILDHFKSHGYDHDYTLIRALAAHGRLVSEDQVIAGDTSSPATPQHPYGSEWK